MLSTLKTQFYTLIKNLGYNITDNAEYRENLPWLMLRTNGYQTMKSFNTNVASATLVLDIFSNYPGEKEIIDIVENIGSHLCELQENNAEILFSTQKTLKILDDKATGPIRKHGVVIYQFLLGNGISYIEEDVDDNTEN